MTKYAVRKNILRGDSNFIITVNLAGVRIITLALSLMDVGKINSYCDSFPTPGTINYKFLTCIARFDDNIFDLCWADKLEIFPSKTLISGVEYIGCGFLIVSHHNKPTVVTYFINM